MNILLVEPSKVVREKLSKHLYASGHEVSEAYDAQQAIEAVDLCIPDLILLNPNLSANNGIELLCEIQSYEDLSTIPVVLMTDSAHRYYKLIHSLEQLNIVLILNRTGLCQETILDAVEHVELKFSKS